MFIPEPVHQTIPAEKDEGYILEGIRSSTYYDRPWYYDEQRSLDLLLKWSFKELIYEWTRPN